MESQTTAFCWQITSANASWGQRRLAPISSTGTSGNTGFPPSPFPPEPQPSCSLPAATASPPREIQPGARPRAPRTEHRAGPCPSPASNQHRPSSMRFNCLFIILAHRGYKEAWHFCAHHPTAPWELSRWKKQQPGQKGLSWTEWLQVRVTQWEGPVVTRGSPSLFAVPFPILFERGGECHKEMRIWTHSPRVHQCPFSAWLYT